MKILCLKDVNAEMLSVNKIKHFLLFTFLIFSHSFLFAQKGKKVVVFDIKEEIAPSATRIADKALKFAIETKADLVIIHMDTYGGLVTDADSIRKIILDMPMPVYVFVENNAASAGALISIACDKIYMKKGASIGAATVVNQSGEAAPDKYQSYMRGKMRATAEAQGRDTVILNGDTTYLYKRNPLIAEAMVDPNVIVEGLVDSTKVVTLTPEEAIKYGFCDGIATSIENVLALNGITDYEIIKVEKSTLDKIIGFMGNPAVSSILLLAVFAGIYFELQTPGIGFPILAAFIAGILYLTPLYLDGLAENWEIMIILLGLILIGLEIFVMPGFGVTGISGIIFLFTGLFLTMIRNVNFDFSATPPEEMTKALAVMAVSLIGFVTVIIFGAKQMLNSSLFKRLILTTTLADAKANEMMPLSDLKGEIAVAYTDIRPLGKALLNDHLLEVKSYGDFIEAGSKIRLISKEDNYWIIEKYHA
jgi:membrane-bound serine protease (ClpP class)